MLIIYIEYLHKSTFCDTIKIELNWIKFAFYTHTYISYLHYLKQSQKSCNQWLGRALHLTLTANYTLLCTEFNYY